MGRFGIIASALFTVVACGDDEGPNQFRDSGLDEDAAGDGPNNPTTVNVTTLAREDDNLPSRAPRAGVIVFAISNTGTLVDNALTNEQGQATVSLPDGGSVTAVYPASGEVQHVATFAGVQPGDNLTFGDRSTYYSPNTGQEGQMTLTWPEVLEAVSYRLYTPCFSGVLGNVLSYSLALNTECQTATGPLGLVAYNQADEVIASLLIPNAAYTPSSALAITAGQWVAQTPGANYAAIVSGLGDDTQDVLIGAFDELAEREFSTFYYATYPNGTTFATPVAGTAMASFSVASSSPRPSMAARVRHDTHAGRQWLYRAGATPVTYDVSSLPWISSFEVDDVNSRLTWTPTAGTADAMILRFTNGTVRWTLILPPTVTTLDPTLAPPEVQEYLPVVANDVEPFSCNLVDLSSAASYDELRMLPEWRATRAESSVRGGDEPAAAYSDCGEGYYY